MSGAVEHIDFAMWELELGPDPEPDKLDDVSWIDLPLPPKEDR
jgi:hypothetical protein